MIPNDPTKALVDYVIQTEAIRANITSRDLRLSHSPPHCEARHRCWRLIIAFSGCSMNGLSTVWGCDRQAIRRALMKLEARAA